MTSTNIAPSQLRDIGFGAGFWASLRAIGTILRSPSLLLMMLAALLINGLLLGLLVWWGWGKVDNLLVWLGWLKVKSTAVGIKYLIMFLKWAVLLLFAYFVFPIIFGIMLNLNPLSAYLASLMFQKVFKQHAGVPLPETDSFLTSLKKLVVSEVRKLAASLFLMVLALCLNFIPLLGAIAATIAFFIINIQFTGWSYVTPYYEALGYGYAQQREAMRKQRMTIWGVGLVSAIPILNFLALFFGPVGGALLTAQLHKERHEQALKD